MDKTDSIAFMRDLEARYREQSGLADRAHYKIFYGPIHPAPILVLGINPGGKPDNTQPDGARHYTGEVAAASASYYENGEHDVVDCDWTENKGLRKLLVPLLDGDETAIRSKVVKTNLAFRRSAKTSDIDIEAAKAEAVPFLAEIMAVVSPRLVLLTSLDLPDFVKRFFCDADDIGEPVRDERIGHVVFHSAAARINGCQDRSVIVRVAHASQFSWTYARYNVAQRILTALRAQSTAPPESL